MSSARGDGDRDAAAAAPGAGGRAAGARRPGRLRRRVGAARRAGGVSRGVHDRLRRLGGAPRAARPRVRGTRRDGGPGAEPGERGVHPAHRGRGHRLRQRAAGSPHGPAVRAGRRRRAPPRGSGRAQALRSPGGQAGGAGGGVRRAHPGGGRGADRSGSSDHRAHGRDRRHRLRGRGRAGGGGRRARARTSSSSRRPRPRPRSRPCRAGSTGPSCSTTRRAAGRRFSRSLACAPSATRSSSCRSISCSSRPARCSGLSPSSVTGTRRSGIPSASRRSRSSAT